jgi:cytidylate kinase
MFIPCRGSVPTPVWLGIRRGLTVPTIQQQKKKIVICLAGLTACGKSTAAKRLAKKYGLKYVSGGTALKELALKMGYQAHSRGWWETPEGMRFLEERLHDPKSDKQIDSQLIELAELGNVVLDSWTMPWLTKRGFKIWLEVSPPERAKRLAKRDGINLKDATSIIEKKDSKTMQIYESLYGFKLGKDYQPFDLVLDSETLSSDEVFDTLSLVIDRLVLKRGR